MLLYRTFLHTIYSAAQLSQYVPAATGCPSEKATVFGATIKEDPPHMIMTVEGQLLF